MNLTRSSSSSTMAQVPVDLLGAPWVGDSGPDLANIYLHARYYDPVLGLFLSPDPIGADMNTYRYGNGDPVNFSDPSGLVAASYVGGTSSCYQGLKEGVSQDDGPVYGDSWLCISNNDGYYYVDRNAGGSNCDEWGCDAWGNGSGGGEEPGPQGPQPQPVPGPTPTPEPTAQVQIEVNTKTGEIKVKVDGLVRESKITTGKGDCINNPGCAGNRNVGPIPAGKYEARKSELSNPNVFQTILRNIRADWGSFRIPLHPLALTDTRGRDGFYLHGGSIPGSAGCIDCGGSLFGNQFTNYLVKSIQNDTDGVVQVNVTGGRN